MLKHLYIDNYKCLVNFNLELKGLTLFLGDNGSGKSSVFEAIRTVQSFLIGEVKIQDLFPASSLTRWSGSKLQTFEFTLENKGAYHYKLLIEHEENTGKSRVNLEQLTFNGNDLFRFEKGEVHLFRDNFSAGPIYSFDWSQSGMTPITERPDNKLLTAFKKEIERWAVVQIIPTLMKDTTDQEETRVSLHLENFSSWYRFLSQEHQDRIFELTSQLREVFETFESFKLTQVGENAKNLKVIFSSEGKSYDYRFSELSDGQRMLIALYTLLYCLKDTTLFIDEPENFLALPEIQPWLLDLKEKCELGGLQSVLISHHPEFVNDLAISSGVWFERTQNTLVRTHQIEENGDFPVAELIARRWVRNGP